MAEVKVFYDQTGNTLTVWFGNPQDECVCEETGEEVILMKDKAGKVIGFEKLFPQQNLWVPSGSGRAPSVWYKATFTT